MRHRLKSAALIGLACLALTACVDPIQPPNSNNNPATNNTTTKCPPGQVRNPITNLCETPKADMPPDIDLDAIPPWADDDGDAVIDRYDNCIGTTNADQMDADADGVGDACDNCPTVANSNQDKSLCEQGGSYDPTTDTDGDMVPDVQDNCPGVNNPDQADNDTDQLGNACDNCPDIANYDQNDVDGNMVGDSCESAPGAIPICDTTESEFMKLDPNIFILLDQSGSMRNDGKMDKAKQALNTMSDQLANEVRFGLATYGIGSSCNASLKLSMGSHSATQIKGSYAGVGPDGGTPTGRAIGDVRNNNWLDENGDIHAAVRPKAFVLITDGATNACGGDSGHNTAVAEVTALNNNGIKTYAIGFGSGASAAQLQQLAQAGGTMNYYTANNSTALVNVLRTIANEVISCSYVLNQPPPDPSKIWVNINGSQVPREANNGFSFDPAGNTVTINGSKCNELRMGNPATTKVQIEFGCATPCQASEEICDYIDNDCDGEIDEGCEGCSPEVCDGMDNDCDGNVDEGCPTCKIEDEMCASDDECCRKSCVEGICGPPCRPDNVSCRNSSDCCNGTCAKNAGQSTGFCISG